MNATVRAVVTSTLLGGLAAAAIPLSVFEEKTLDGDQIAAVAATIELIPSLASDPNPAVSECLSNFRKRTISIYPRKNVVMALLSPAAECWGPETVKTDGDILLVFERGSVRHLETVRG